VDVCDVIEVWEEAVRVFIRQFEGRT